MSRRVIVLAIAVPVVTIGTGLLLRAVFIR
jgi:hypothetical protein